MAQSLGSDRDIKNLTTPHSRMNLSPFRAESFGQTTDPKRRASCLNIWNLCLWENRRTEAQSAFMEPNRGLESC